MTSCNCTRREGAPDGPARSRHRHPGNSIASDRSANTITRQTVDGSWGVVHQAARPIASAARRDGLQERRWSRCRLRRQRSFHAAMIPRESARRMSSSVWWRWSDARSTAPSPACLRSRASSPVVVVRGSSTPGSSCSVIALLHATWSGPTQAAGVHAPLLQFPCGRETCTHRAQLSLSHRPDGGCRRCFRTRFSNDMCLRDITS